jgi:hypothetical protein
LMPARYVDNAQPPVAEKRVLVLEDAASIGPPMLDNARHPPEYVCTFRCIVYRFTGNKSGDSTHCADLIISERMPLSGVVHPSSTIDKGLTWL